MTADTLTLPATPTPTTRLIVGIDASRSRSGGTRAHLLGLLGSADPRAHGIEAVHVWSHSALIDALPDFPWLVKHKPALLNASLPMQVWWQQRRLPSELAAKGCSMLLSVDAGTVSTWRPSVVMSRDMLSFEPGEMARFRLSYAWLRLQLLKYLQIRSLRQASGALFLTSYAARMIQRETGPLSSVRIIPHGVGETFRRPRRTDRWPGDGAPVRCVYVSNADMYKHQWHVVRAVGQLRQAGYQVTLKLVGGGHGRPQTLLDDAIAEVDPQRGFIDQLDFVRHDQVPDVLAEADLFIFASSCENMPNTLVEAMAGGLPIACSDRGPMPEILQDGGVYFDPESPPSIAAALARLLDDPALRAAVAARALQLSAHYSWQRCARETWDFVAATAVQAASATSQAITAPTHS